MKAASKEAALIICVRGWNYFFGASLRTSTMKSQNLATLGTYTLSSGEWGEQRVGPHETISQLGYLAPSMPHSSPAWIAMTAGSLPYSFL